MTAPRRAAPSTPAQVHARAEQLSGRIFRVGLACLVGLALWGWVW